MSGILKSYYYSGAAGAIVCVLIDGGTLIVLAAYGGRACVIIHTLDRYWKVVHPIHHRKYYRRWMVKVGIECLFICLFVCSDVSNTVSAKTNSRGQQHSLFTFVYLFIVSVHKITEPYVKNHVNKSETDSYRSRLA